MMNQSESFILRPKSKAQLFAYYEQKQLDVVQSRIEENVLLFAKKKTLHQSNFIINCLKNHFIFYNLSESELENVKQKMFYCDVDENCVVYDTNTVGNCFFIVERGSMDLIIDGKVKRIIKTLQGFGELALLYNTKRTSTIVARQSSSLWVIDRRTFRDAVEEVIIRDYNENRKYLDGMRFFMNLTNQQKDLIASSITTQRFGKNQVIIQQGDPGSCFYFIKEGVASVFKGNKFVKKIGKGDSFGQQSLYYNTMRQLTIKTDDEVFCLVLRRDTLNRVLNQKIYDVTFKNFLIWSFQKNRLLNKLSETQKERVIDAMKIIALKTNQSVFKKGVPGLQKIVVVIQGSLKKLKSGAVVATKGQCFGDQFLLQINKSKMMDDEVVMQSYGVVAQISDTIFYESIGGVSYQQVIKKVQRSKQKSILHFENNLKKQTFNLNIQQVIVVKQIAKAQFGPVFMVKDAYSNIYCVKAISKSLLDKFQVERFIKEEKNILETVAFPFILQLGKTFQTESHLFYLTQYIYGQQFYQVIRNIGLLSTYDSKFYAASIILILQYLHENQIAYRDIKPQNFMVDSKGYLKLISFSTAKITRSENMQICKTFTIIGTPHYMAPDIIIGKGYTNLVDLWSLGVCIYQFLCGLLPFGDSSENPYDIYQEIMQNELKFPQFINDRKAKKIVEQLLNHVPQQRHGGSFLSLKTHCWFQQFPWNDLISKNDQVLQPPYFPQISIKSLKQLAMTNENGRLIDYVIQIPDQSDQENPKSQKLSQSHKSVFQWESFGEILESENIPDM